MRVLDNTKSNKHIYNIGGFKKTNQPRGAVVSAPFLYQIFRNWYDFILGDADVASSSLAEARSFLTVVSLLSCRYNCYPRITASIHGTGTYVLRIDF